MWVNLYDPKTCWVFYKTKEEAIKNRHRAFSDIEPVEVDGKDNYNSFNPCVHPLDRGEAV